MRPVIILAAITGRSSDRKRSAAHRQVEGLGPGEEGHDMDIVILAEGERAAQLALPMIQELLGMAPAPAAG